ncbi:MAG TPA: hypothetical protein VFC42_05125 [Methylomirabilota bacterium]|nr:hypothetical protein [Methylomirabilota bacterium]
MDPEARGTHVGRGDIALLRTDWLGRPRVRFVALPLRLEGGDGAPARANAIRD